MDILYVPEIYVFIQVLVAMLLGGLIGLERSVAGKAAGMRTFGLVALGACLFTTPRKVPVAPLRGWSGVEKGGRGKLRVFPVAESSPSRTAGSNL